MVQELPLEPLSLPGGGGVAAGPTHLERLEHMKEEVGVADPAKEQQQQSHIHCTMYIFPKKLGQNG